MAGQACRELKISFVPFPAHWDIHGRAAGPIRNQQMLDEGLPDMVIAFHDDIASSKGTKDMISRAEKNSVPYQVVRYGDRPTMARQPTV